MNSDNLRILNALKAIADKLGADDKANVSENEVGKIAEELERIAMIKDLKPEPSGGGGGSLSELSDTAITSPSDNDVLTYDSDSGKWKNAAGGSGGGFLKVGITLDEQTQDFNLDKTWQVIKDAVEAGWHVSVVQSEDGYTSQMAINEVVASGDAYEVHASEGDGFLNFTTDSADGYPVLNQDDNT